MKMNRRDFLGAAATTLASSINASSLTTKQQPTTIRGIRAIAFDALVIFDLGIVARRTEQILPGRGSEFTSLWRTRQFEYTWLRTAGERYRNFWQVTQDALNYAVARMGLHLSPAERDNLMNAYRELQVWPDVAKMLADLRAEGIRMAFLSNFTAEMISTNLNAAGLSGFFEEHLTTDRVQAFKPSPRAYQMGIDHFACRQEEIAFAAFAPWDAAGAKWFGYRTLWINRASAPLEELSVTPDFVAPSLSSTSLLPHLLFGPKYNALVYSVMDDVRIRPAQPVDVDQLARMCEDLWPKSSAEEHAKELRLMLEGKADQVLTMPLTILVAEAGGGRLVGLVEVDLRSHADGCNPAQAVGYIEGWYVVKEYRNRGVGKELIAEAEHWARSHKCSEMASDALIDNEVSQRAHEALGYEVVDRCVHYRKRL